MGEPIRIIYETLYALIRVKVSFDWLNAFWLDNGAYSRSIKPGDGGTSTKRQQLPYSLAESDATEVRAMECIRQLLLRSAEALFLLQYLCQHHVTRLVQGFDGNLRGTVDDVSARLQEGLSELLQGV